MEDTIAITGERYAVVTGGNKGIGLGICRKLATEGIRVILTARSANRGIEAVEELKASGLKHVVFHQLDVKDPSSIASLANFIETNFTKLDIPSNRTELRNGRELFKNKLFWSQGSNRSTCSSSTTIRFTKNCEPLIQLRTTDGNEAHKLVHKFINYYNQQFYISLFHDSIQVIPNDKVKEGLGNLESLTEDKIDVIVQRFLKDFKDDKLEANGWPITVSAYKVSKVAISAYTRLLARKYPDFLVNCVHPGYVETDITANTGPMTPEEGARAPVMVALLPDGGPSGRFFMEMEASDF